MNKEKENKELKDLNIQYFNNIITLSKDIMRLKIVTAFELCLIIILLVLSRIG